MHQALTGPIDDGCIAGIGGRATAPLAQKLLPPLSPILLGLVAAKDHERTTYTRLPALPDPATTYGDSNKAV